MISVLLLCENNHDKTKDKENHYAFVIFCFGTCEFVLHYYLNIGLVRHIS